MTSKNPYGAAQDQIPGDDRQQVRTGDRSFNIVCPACNTDNLAKQSFCGKCGGHLWTQCLNCNSRCAASDIYCGNCGRSNREAEAELIRKAELCLEIAESYASRFDFRSAALELSTIRNADHPCLAGILGRRDQLAERIASERSRHEVLRDRALARVDALLAQYDYAAAVSVLEQIPEAVRNEQVTRLLNQSRDKAESVKTLKREVLEGSGKLPPRELALKIESLLALVPHDTQIQNWSRKLRDHFLSAARKHLAACQYAEACALLDHLPVTEQVNGHAADIQKLTRQARELKWLSEQLRIAPYADATLLEIGRRLAKAVPNDEFARQAVGRLESSLSAPLGTATPVPWARAPEKTRLGAPVEPLSDLPGIVLAPDAKAAVSASPGSFAGACGLALQGLGMAHIDTNLIPEQKGLWKILKRGRDSKAAWGLDIGAFGLKAVRLETGSGDLPHLTHCCCIPHQIPLGRPEAKDARSQIFRETVAAFRSQHKAIAGERIVVNWPSFQLLARYLVLPPVTGRKLERSIEYEARHQIPFPLDSVAWDYYPFPDRDGETTPRPVILLVAKRDFVLSRLEDLNAAEVQPDILQAHPIALHNYLHHACFRNQPADNSKTAEAIAAIEVGGESTNFVFSTADGPWFRLVGIGGTNITEAIIPALKLTFAQADQMKKQLHRLSRMSEFDTLATRVYERLVSEYEQSVAMFCKSYGEHRIRKVLGMGSGFASWGLLRFLRHGR